ncbi:MAG: glycosyltransferase family 87 protein, partial [Acidobacteriota bacterium]
TRTAGQVIVEHGFGAAYDAALLEEPQRELYEKFVRDSGLHGLPFYVVPVPYPPPFTLAFVPSTLLPPIPGFISWTLFHVVVLTLYELRLAKYFAVTRPGMLIAAVVLSAPAFIHLIMGQLSVWLVVFFGESLIAFEKHMPVRSGIWLALLVCKPQVLVLILPALLLARQWRILLGMIVATVALIAPTFLLSPGWFADFLGGIFDAAGSSGTVMNIFPSSMTNWRAFALNASHYLPPKIVWPAAVAAMLATAIAGLSCSFRLRSRALGRQRLAWLGLAASTCALSWHAHVHQSLLLVPPVFAVIGVWPGLKDPAVFACMGTSAVFLVASTTLGIGEAHDILGLAMLAGLIVLTAICALSLQADPAPG